MVGNIGRHGDERVPAPKQRRTRCDASERPILRRFPGYQPWNARRFWLSKQLMGETRIPGRKERPAFR